MTSGVSSISPHLVRGPGGPWSGVAHDLGGHGVTVVYGAVRPWVDALPHGHELSRIVGRDRARMDGFTRASARQEFGAIRYFVKCAAAIALSCDPGQVDLAYTVQGRMQIRGEVRLHLNLSHTDGVAVLALADSAPVGVDVEFADRSSAPDPLDRTVVTDGERAILLGISDPEDRRSRAVELWTLKEAYSKALGQGMTFPFAEIDLGFDGTAWFVPGAHRDGDRADPLGRTTARQWVVDDPTGTGRGGCVVSAVTLTDPTVGGLFENVTRLAPSVVSMARSVRGGPGPL